MTAIGKQVIRPYGDRRDDGVVQLSFTLPVPISERAKEAAAQLIRKMGFVDVKVAAAEPAADHYTFFIVYARSTAQIDYSEVNVPELVVRKLGFDDLNKLIEEKIGRRIVVFGACTGTDTHTVGIDAILNMKGYAGDYGLERYPWCEVYNLGSQVPNEELIEKAIAKAADAILVSQVVTDPLAARRAAGRSSLGAATGIRRRLWPGNQAFGRCQLHRSCLAEEDGKRARGVALPRRAPVSLRATLRIRMNHHDAHYGGNLVDGARLLGLFGDLATELLIRQDGDEGLFRAYESVEFLSPVFAGDFIEAEGELLQVGATSRKMKFEARKVIQPLPKLSDSAAEVLPAPVVVCRAIGTCVVPKQKQRLR